MGAVTMMVWVAMDGPKAVVWVIVTEGTVV